MMAINYRNSLNNLFQEISKLGSEGVNMDNQNLNNNVQNAEQPVQNNANQFAQNFQDETMKRKEKLCEIGFWISICGVLGALGGVAIGLLVYIMDFYFASQGLKTRKRGKAIATIVLSIVSIIITIIQLLAVA